MNLKNNAEDKGTRQPKDVAVEQGRGQAGNCPGKSRSRTVITGIRTDLESEPSACPIYYPQNANYQWQIKCNRKKHIKVPFWICFKSLKYYFFCSKFVPGSGNNGAWSIGMLIENKDFISSTSYPWSYIRSCQTHHFIVPLLPF